MKKILIFLLLVFISTSVYSQDVKFLRASKLTIGFRPEPNSKIQFQPSTDVDILIKLEATKATVYSDKTQTYRVIRLKDKTDTYTEYVANNSDGKVCNIMLMTIPDSPGKIFFSVEFSDYIWFYTTTLE
jgi:hypothetical protein